jgi:hypothetical protein
VRRRPLHLAVLTTCAALCLGAGSAALAASLPPQLIARMKADRSRAEHELATARKQLAVAAEAQREGAADAARVVYPGQVAADLAKVFDATVPTPIARDVQEGERPAHDKLAKLDAALEATTEDTARAQAAALDADRRIRALQRASATEDERDTTLGSWRFGSGGPPVSAQSIDDYLASKGSPMAGQGAAFLEAGVEREVDPRFIVAISGAESYFGITTCASFNAWGWGCPSSPFSFDSWKHAIDTVTLGLRENYIDDGLETVGEIHLRYAPPDATNDPNDLNYGWADNVAKFLIEQGGDPQDIAGVLGPST